MKLTFEAVAERRRLRFKGEHWREILVCVHGQKLRWRCAECEAYFKAHDKPKPKKPSEPWRGD